MKRKQLTVIGLVVVLMGLLLSLKIKGLVKEENQNDASTETAADAPAVSAEALSEAAKPALNENLAKQITDLENALQTAEGAEKLELQKKLAQQWDDVNQPAPAAMYYEAAAEAENTYSGWLKAGDLFTDAYQSTRDTLVHPALVQKAAGSYQRVLELQPSSLEAKTGLGTAYVNGSNPMQGIELLLAVVKEDPENIKANLNLGLFSMRSGQYDKAVDRFKTVIKKKPSPEAWFYLASSYEHLGMKTEAISAFEKSKELAADPGLTKFVDQKIQELSN